MPLGTRFDTAHQFCQLVQMRTSDGIADLAVEVDENEIRIRGRAASYYVKQLATQAVLEVSRSRSVCNEILVEST